MDQKGKILYLHQYFKTPAEGGAIRSYYIAKAMVEAGFEVEMITAHNQSYTLTTNIEGITVHYLPVRYSNSFGFVGRIFAFLKFMWMAYFKSFEIKNIQYCYATSTPLSIGLIGMMLKKVRKLRFVFEVRDLWPLAPVEIGFIRNPLLKRMLFYLEKKIYQSANQIVVLSPTMQEYVEKIVPRTPLICIPNMADCDFFSPAEKNQELAQKYQLQGKFIIGYFGSISIANHLDYLLQVAYFLKNNPFAEVHFIIAGEGNEKQSIEQKIKENSLENVFLLPSLDKNQVREWMNLCDAVYISFLHLPVLESNSPNKFFDGLAAGKLIITNIEGWIKNMIEAHQCGFYYPPDDFEYFIKKIKQLMERDVLQAYQKNARALAEKEFSRAQLCEKLIHWLG